MTDEGVEKTLQEDLGACFSWLRWSISDDLRRHVVYGSSLYEGKQKHFLKIYKTVIFRIACLKQYPCTVHLTSD